MTRENMTQTINWLGTEYRVKITWEIEDNEIIFILCQIDNKEVVRFFRKRWKDPAGKRYDPSEFIRLKKCCIDKFKHPRYTTPAIAPLFTILLGEQM
ncbi:MAG: hypothetical protein U9R29_06460 [Thermodesulfobacteriota bacterium]|nr:hypothetical protein [Thermodesulfobacteriota bacterium]